MLSVLFDLMVIFQRWDILAFEMPSLLFLAEGYFLGVPPALSFSGFCCRSSSSFLNNFARTSSTHEDSEGRSFVINKHAPLHRQLIPISCSGGCWDCCLLLLKEVLIEVQLTSTQ